MSARRLENGFSVIEALVALAIVALALIPLMALQAQVSRTYARDQLERAELNAKQNALALLRDVNVLASPQGARRLDSAHLLRWWATPLTAPTRTTRQGQGFGDFEIVLFRVDAAIEGGAPPRAPVSFSLEQVGWRPLATASSAPPQDGRGQASE